MKPTKKLKWVKGLRNALRTVNATQSDQYSWIAKIDDTVIFSAERDHIDKEHNQYSHSDGVFHKICRPLSVAEGDSAITVRHANELYEAVSLVFLTDKRCRLMVLKGTKYGSTSGGIVAAIDSDNWRVKQLEGNVADGFEFTLIRVS